MASRLSLNTAIKTAVLLIAAVFIFSPFKASAEILFFNNEDIGAFYTNTGSDKYFNYFTNIEASTTLENVGLYLRWIATSSDVDIRIGVASGYNSETNTITWLEYCDYPLTNTEWELIDCPINQVINGDLLLAVDYGDNQGDYEIMLSPDKYGAAVSHYINGVQVNYDEYAFIIEGYNQGQIAPVNPTATNTMALITGEIYPQFVDFVKIIFTSFYGILLVVVILAFLAGALYTLVDISRHKF